MVTISATTRSEIEAGFASLVEQRVGALVIGGDAFFNQVFLDQVFVPDDCLVGEVNKGWRIARTCAGGCAAKWTCVNQTR